MEKMDEEELVHITLDKGVFTKFYRVISGQIPESSLKKWEKQRLALSLLSGEGNTPKLLDYDHKTYSIAMVECLGQQLYKWLCYKTDPFSDSTVRHLLKEVMKALKEMAAVGFSHLNVNLENIVIERNDRERRVIVKLVDFAYAHQIKIVKGEEAPPVNYFTHPQKESHLALPSQVHDIFGLGILVFQLKFRKSPEPDSSLLKNHFLNENYEEFWKKQEEKGISPSTSLKNMLNRMLCYSSCDTYTFSELEADPWLNEEFTSMEDVYKEFLGIGGPST